MPSALLQRLLEEVTLLSPEEQAELKQFLEKCLLEALDQRLLEKGAMTRIPPPPTAADLERWAEWKPIEIGGRPLSETILEERR